MSKRTAWITAFLSVTVLALAGELYAAFDSSSNTTPWTELIVRYVPWPVTAIGIAALCAWLPWHFWTNYRSRKGQLMTSPTIPTQQRHPWRATLRTLLAAAVALATLAPEVAASAHVDTLPAVAQLLAVAAAVTRIIAIPGVDNFLRRFLPWLASSPRA